jgi:hypothetical protein
VTLLIEPAPELLIDVLRGDRARRPRRDDTTAAGLRALLEDHVFGVFGAERHGTPVIVSSATMRSAGPSCEISDSSLSRARGMAISILLRLLVAQVHVENPFDDAVCAWRGERYDDALLSVVDHLDANQAARLRADVGAHFATLSRSLGPIPSNWWPRTSLRARQILGGGNVQLRDVVDLAVGATHSDLASVALVDVTTSPLGAGAERVMRFHALVQTLRTSVVPLRTSMFSSATGELWSLDVDVELLMRAVDDLVSALDNAEVPS